MSYHILHQFDEQWFADGRQDASSRPDDFSDAFFRAGGDQRHDRQESRIKFGQRPWLIVTVSLIIAACALYFAMDTRRQTIDLQQRLTDLETRLK